MICIRLYRHQEATMAPQLKAESWTKAQRMHREEVVTTQEITSYFSKRFRFTRVKDFLIDPQVLEEPDLQGRQNQLRPASSHLKWRWRISQSWLVFHRAKQPPLFFRKSAGVQFLRPRALKRNRLHLPGRWAHWTVRYVTV